MNDRHKKKGVSLMCPFSSGGFWTDPCKKNSKDTAHTSDVYARSTAWAVTGWHDSVEGERVTSFSIARIIRVQTFLMLRIVQIHH